MIVLRIYFIQYLIIVFATKYVDDRSTTFIRSDIITYSTKKNETIFGNLSEPITGVLLTLSCLLNLTSARAHPGERGTRNGDRKLTGNSHLDTLALNATAKPGDSAKLACPVPAELSGIVSI